MKIINLIALIVLFVTNKSMSQNVGIGTNTPNEKLDVNGGIKIGATNNTAKGTIRWNEAKSDFEGYNGAGWVSLTGGKSSWGNQQSFTTESGASQVVLNNGVGTSDGRELGNALAMSGKVLVAGAKSDNSTSHLSSYMGSVYIFKKNTIEWKAANVIYNPTGQPSEYFGTDVDIHNSLIIVGAPGFNIGAQYRVGRAYIYQHDTAANTNTLQATLSASDADEEDRFGTGVALFANYAAASSPYNDVGILQNIGRVYTFRKNGSSWLHQSVLTAPDAAQGDAFGFSISMSGNWLAVSAPSADVNNITDVGKVYLYKLSSDGLAWNYVSTLMPPPQQAQQNYGFQISLSADALAIGSNEIGIGPNENSGKVYVYHRNGDSWILQATVTAPDANLGDYFGQSVDIGNGYLIVGATGATVGANRLQGKSYIYKWNGNGYVHEATLISTNGEPFDLFGTSVAIGESGAAVGAPNAAMDDYYPQNGRVYFYYK